MPTYRLTLEYDGGAYAGWQRQPGVATVEGALRTAITAVCQEEPQLTAAGRTDAGAHSHGQVVGLRLNRTWVDDRLSAALNSALPDDVVVVSASVVADGFHARHDAIARSYRYLVVPRRKRSPTTRHYTWLVDGPLDLDAMRAAASGLHGNHDFAAFGKATNPGGSTRRTISSVAVSRLSVHGPTGQEPLDAVVIEVSANAFLYGMMRTIAGALVAVGQGRLTDADLRDMLRNPQASHRHVTVAPAHGLHQWTVTYA